MYILEVYLSLVFPLFDPEELNSKINQSFKNQEKVEAEAQGLEKKLLENYEFKKSMIPERKWGQPFDPSKLTMTAKFIIEKHQPAVASYLGFNSGYHSRQEEIEKAREEAAASMAKKIATLQQQNEEQKKSREYRLRNNLNVGTGFPNF